MPDRKKKVCKHWEKHNIFFSVLAIIYKFVGLDFEFMLLKILLDLKIFSFTWQK